jgi:hypothetical protein
VFYSHFLKPFDSDIWSFLVSVGLAISILMSLFYTCLEKMRVFSLDILLRLVMALFGILIDNALRLPRKLERHIWMRIGFMTWALGTIILGNLYKGTVTSNFIAPTGEGRIKKFEETYSRKLNLSVYSSVSKEVLELLEAGRQKGLTVNLVRHKYFKFFDRLDYDKEWIRRLAKNETTSMLLKVIRNLWQNIITDVDISETNQFPKEFVQNCNSSIFVDTSVLLPKILHFHRNVHPNLPIYFGEDKLMDVAKHIHTYGIAKGAMTIRLRALAHSGILQRIIEDKEFVSNRKLLRRYKSQNNSTHSSILNVKNDSSRVRALTMLSNSMKIFVVTACTLGLSLIIFFYEIMKSIILSKLPKKGFIVKRTKLSKWYIVIEFKQIIIKACMYCSFNSRTPIEKE